MVVEAITTPPAIRAADITVADMTTGEIAGKTDGSTMSAVGSKTSAADWKTSGEINNILRVGNHRQTRTLIRLRDSRDHSRRVRMIDALRDSLRVSRNARLKSAQEAAAIFAHQAASVV